MAMSVLDIARLYREAVTEAFAASESETAFAAAVVTQYRSLLAEDDAAGAHR